MRVDERRQLDLDGFVVLKRRADTRLVARLRRRIEALFDEEGDRGGSEFKLEPGCDRLANLVNKGPVFREAIALPCVLESVQQVLGSSFKLSSLNARRVPGHSDRLQPLHADMAAVADTRGYWVCNVVWMLDEVTPDNGAIRVVPGSHRWGRLPADALEDPSATHPDEVVLTGPAGTWVVLNAHAWHGGLPNRTAASRTAMHAFYCRGDKPQQQYQKDLLDPAVQQALPPQLRELLALDDPLNDEVSTRVTTRSGLLD